MKRDNLAAHALTFLFTTTLSSTALSGGMDIGGGYGFVCFKDAATAEQVIKNDYQLTEKELELISNIATQDLYVAKQLSMGIGRKGRLLAPKQGESLDDLLERIVQHVESLSPELGATIRESQEAFSGPSVQLDSQLPRPADHGTFFGTAEGVNRIDKEHCVRVPLAVQFKTDDMDVVSFNSKLLEHKKMSLMSKAVLWLHELIYHGARTHRGHKRSVPTSIAISFLLQEEGGVGPERIDEVLRSLDLIGPTD